MSGEKTSIWTRSSSPSQPSARQQLDTRFRQTSRFLRKNVVGMEIPLSRTSLSFFLSFVPFQPPSQALLRVYKSIKNSTKTNVISVISLRCLNNPIKQTSSRRQKVKVTHMCLYISVYNKYQFSLWSISSDAESSRSRRESFVTGWARALPLYSHVTPFQMTHTDIERVRERANFNN